MLGNKLLVVTALRVPAHQIPELSMMVLQVRVSGGQAPELARPSLKVSFLLCFVSLSPSLGFGLVSVFLSYFSSFELPGFLPEKHIRKSHSEGSCHSWHTMQKRNFSC